MNRFPFDRKYIVVNICDDEEYEKNVVFYLELGEPKLIKTAGGKQAQITPKLKIWKWSATKVVCASDQICYTIRFNHEFGDPFYFTQDTNPLSVSFIVYNTKLSILVNHSHR